MNDTRSNYKLGLFVFLALVVLFVVLFILGGRTIFEPKIIIETYFDESISGLEVGSPVRYRGITVGEVSSIELSDALYEQSIPREQRKSYVVVRSEITAANKTVQEWKRNIDISINRGLRATTQLAGITGQQYLSFDYSGFDVGLEFSWESEYPYIPSTKSSTGKIVSGIQHLIDRLDEADIEKLVININQLIETLNRAVGDVETGKISQEILSLTTNTNHMIIDVDNLIKNPDVEIIFSSLSEVSKQLNSSLKDEGEINSLIKNIDQVSRRIDILLSDNQYDVSYIIKDLRVTAENLKIFSRYLKDNPSSLIFSKEPERLEIDED